MLITLTLIKTTTQYYKFSFSDDKIISNIYLKKDLFKEEPKSIDVEIKNGVEL